VRLTFLLAAPLFALLGPRAVPAQAPEALWYATNDEASVQSFLAHADRIGVVAPQAFALDSLGAVSGHIDPRIVARAAERHVRLIPLIVNPDFDQPAFHRVLVTTDAWRRAVRGITALCRDNHYEGIQFDFENIAVTDRDVFSRFSREVADSLHAAHCSLSAAVVPRASEERGIQPYSQWMFDNWRGAYDYRALADAMDFLSFMTYSQHTRRTPPGPVAGYPWMESAVRYVMSLGVPPAKLSLGIPAYSQYWHTTWDSAGGARSTGRGATFASAASLLASHHATATWDPAQRESVAWWENEGVFEWLFLEDVRAFDARLALMRQYRLRGYSVWVLGQEDPAIWALPSLR
jgi:spore germination protein YaaH